MPLINIIEFGNVTEEQTTNLELSDLALPSLKKLILFS